MVVKTEDCSVEESMSQVAELLIAHVTKINILSNCQYMFVLPGHHPQIHEWRNESRGAVCG